MDELSTKLSNMKIGFTIGNKLINHIFYADDILIISPSVKSLQILIDNYKIHKK